MGTGKTGGHWKPCNIGSVEAHNERRPDYLEAVKKAGLNLYFFEQLTKNNSHWVSSHDRYCGKTVADVFEAMKKLYTEKTGQPPQLTEKIKKNKKTGKEYKCAGWSPIREMCVPIKEDTKVEDFDYLKKWAEKYGIEIIRIDLHKDEGYHDKETGEYKMNYHAHVVASFLDWNTGRTVKPNKEAMSEMQTVLAMALNMERGQRKADTGKQYLDHQQYREMMAAVDGEKEKIKAELADKKLLLDTINAEIAKATKKVKSFSTMIANLESQRRQPLQEMAELEAKAQRGEITPEELEKLTQELANAIGLIEQKIADKKAKYDEATEQVSDLSLRKHKLQNLYDDLMRQVVKVEPDVFDKTQQEVNSNMWETATSDIKKGYTALETFSKTLTAEQQHSLKCIMATHFENVAQHGEQIAGVAAALFLGYTEQANEFAKNNGGGGMPTSTLQRKQNETDESFRQRCCNTAKKMMQGENAEIYKRWPEAKDAVAAICSLGTSRTAKDFTPQQALNIEKAIVFSGTNRTEAASSLLRLAQRVFERHRTPQAWIANASNEVLSIARGTHQRLTALLKQQPKDVGGGPSYITDLTDWAGNQVKR